MPKPINPNKAKEELARKPSHKIPYSKSYDCVYSQIHCMTKDLEMALFMHLATANIPKQEKHNLLDIVLKWKSKDSMEYFLAMLLVLDCSIKIKIENVKNEYPIEVDFNKIKDLYNKQHNTTF